MHYIEELRRQELKQTLVLLLAAGWSTDIGNVDDEVFLALWYNCNAWE